MSKYLFFLVVLLFFSLIGGLSSCKKNDVKKVKEVTTNRVILPAESGTNVEIIYSDSAKITMRLSAPLMDRFEGEKAYTEFKKGLKLIQYDYNEKPVTQIECNYAINYTEEQKLEAKDDVIVINKDGERLNTEHLIWDKKQQKIYTEEHVIITTKDEVIKGKGLESNEDFTEYKIKKVTGTIQLNEEDEEIQ